MNKKTIYKIKTLFRKIAYKVFGHLYCPQEKRALYTLAHDEIGVAIRFLIPYLLDHSNGYPPTARMSRKHFEELHYHLQEEEEESAAKRIQ
jgi:hypothetical protein